MQMKPRSVSFCFFFLLTETIEMAQMRNVELPECGLGREREGERAGALLWVWVMSLGSGRRVGTECGGGT